MRQVGFFICLAIFSLIIYFFIVNKKITTSIDGYYISEDNRAFIIIIGSEISFNGNKGIINILDKDKRDFEIVLEDDKYYGFYNDNFNILHLYKSNEEEKTAKMLTFKLKEQ